jgi:hypothetical protein
MDKVKTTLERAFELARSGKYQDMGAVRSALQSEGYASQQLVGPNLLRQLRLLVVQSKPPVSDTPDERG